MTGLATPIVTGLATPSATSPGAETHRPAPRRPVGFLSTVTAAVLAAILASAGTLAIVMGTVMPRLQALEAAASAAPTAATATAADATAASIITVDEQSITGIVAQARRSVVTITATITATTRGPFGRTYGATGVGSGLVVTADGYILTNRHVVEGASSLSVALPDGTSYPGSVVQVSSTDDLALVKIDATGLTPAKLGDSSTIEVGQTALAIGSPLGEYTQTVTRGIISALNRSIDVSDATSRNVVTLTHLIQTDAAINEGNSGGPLLDAAGQVIGINTAIASSSEGLGFSTPINAAADLLHAAGL